jgi:hypothetical protein
LIGVATRCSIARCDVPEITTYQLHTNQSLFRGAATKPVPSPDPTGLTCLGPVPTEELVARYYYRGISQQFNALCMRRQEQAVGGKASY